MQTSIYRGDISHFTSRKLFDENIVRMNDRRFPRLSVVIPTLNQGKFLEKSLLSILNQNYPNTEIIVIDGGSTDNTLSIIKNYEKYIYYWESGKDKGQADAINRGFKVATGDFLAWQNSDDVYLPGALSKVAEIIRKNPSYDVYYSNILVIDENDRVIDAFRVFRFGLFFNLYDDIVVHNQCAFFRREKVFQVGLLDDRFKFCFDLDFVSRIMISGSKLFPINEYLAAFRVHSGSKTSKIIDIWKKEKDEIVAKYSSFTLNLPPTISYMICKSIKLVYLLTSGDLNYIALKISKRLRSKRT